MVIVSCPAAGTQPTAGNWSWPRAQRNNVPLTATCATLHKLTAPTKQFWAPATVHPSLQEGSTCSVERNS